jgi:transposase
MTRRKFTTKFKTEVALSAIREQQTLSDLAQKFELHPNQISQWKREFLNNAEKAFGSDGKSKKTQAEEKEQELINLIGQQRIELEFLKKKLG